MLAEFGNLLAFGLVRLVLLREALALAVICALDSGLKHGFVNGLHFLKRCANEKDLIPAYGGYARAMPRCVRLRVVPSINEVTRPFQRRRPRKDDGNGI